MQPFHQAEAGDGAATQLDRGAGQADRIGARECRAGDDVGQAPGKVSIAARALVGHEIDGDAALHERGGERLGRKQVPACPARRHENERPAAVFFHHAAPPAFLSQPGNRAASLSSPAGGNAGRGT